MDDLQIVFVTVSDEEEAGRIAKVLIEENLAACVNIIPGIRSVYRWEGSIEHEDETLLIIKTGKTKIEGLKKRIQEVHSYDIPELLVLPVVDGLEAYMRWARGELREDENG